jgi:hypothetical protein
MTVHPELMSDDPTHIYMGVKVKLFKSALIINDHGTAEIMEGVDKGKLTTVVISKLEALDGKRS